MTTRGTADRRRARRHQRVEEHGIVAAHVRPGYDVSLLDVSADGALVEGRQRLLPGASVELHLTAGDRRAAVRGRVLRCSVSRLRANAVCYRTAIAFDSSLPWFTEQDSIGYQVPGPEHRLAGPNWARATHHVA